ncbi:MAG TPA: C25 family cysteine peptidase [Blastocatellia bacterium]|nr:C25 family cysteine peptidase [Blastocatellia bacterium]
MLALISVGLLASFQLLSSQALGQTGTCAACVSGAQTCTGLVTAGDPDAAQRPQVDGTGSTCGGALSCGTLDPTLLVFRYDLYSFKNTTGATRCLQVTLNNTLTCGISLFSAAYSPTFVPGLGNACTNYIADIGASVTAGTTVLYSFNVANNQQVQVTVIARNAGQVCTGNYQVTFDYTDSTLCPTHVSNNPTEIELASFTTTDRNGRALIEWQSGFEADNLGYNVYREENGKRTRLNRQIVAGSALLTGVGTTLAAGRSYYWWDNAPPRKGNALYWLEELDLAGQSKWHGPALAGQSANSAPPASDGSMLLSGLSPNVTSSSNQVERRATLAAITPAQMSVQSDVASRPALKLAVKQEGWYRVSQQDLVAAGLDAATDPRNLQLFVDGQQQAILVRGQEDGRLDAGDAVEFFGLGLDTFSTDSRTYWLVSGSQAGQRISQGKVKGKRDANASFPYTVERRDRTIFIPSLKTESYFGAIIGKDPIDQVLNLPHANLSGAQQAKIDVSLQGVTLQQHRVNVLLNDDILGEVVFDGQAQGRTTFSVPPAWLRQGDNKITLRAEAGDLDFSVVDAIRITYQHAYTADGDALRFTASPKQKVTVDGFTSSSIRVVDITDPNEAREVTGKIQQQGSAYAITIGVPKHGERTLLAFADAQARRPSAITANESSSWRQPDNSADLVIISHRDFLDSVKPLAELRKSQGLSVAVANVEDIYDEFSFGHKSPQALKDFLSYAKTNWQKAPRFALLVGDATNDPRNFLGKGEFDFVPTKMIATHYNQTASDGWFADFADNGLPEIAIGRLPVRTAQEANTMIGKIVGFDQTSKSGGVLFVSDDDSGFDFEGTSAELKSFVPSDLRIDELRRSQMDTDALRSSLIDNLNRGERIVNYVGHGSVEMWRGGILTPSDARNLTNGQPLPFFMAVTCLNGYFQDPVSDSLAESLMKAERGGAVAVLASSGFIEPGPQAVMARQMFQLIFGSESMTVGEMVTRAKASVSDIDVRRTYTLFGDPSTRLK